jgi:hypothetical protein
MSDQNEQRVEQFARFMQARDARTFKVQDRDGNFQSWDEIGEMGREEYVKDAVAYLNAIDVIDRGIIGSRERAAVRSRFYDPESDHDLVVDGGWHQSENYWYRVFHGVVYYRELKADE